MQSKPTAVYWHKFIYIPYIEKLWSHVGSQERNTSDTENPCHIRHVVGSELEPVRYGGERSQTAKVSCCDEDVRGSIFFMLNVWSFGIFKKWCWDFDIPSRLEAEWIQTKPFSSLSYKSLFAWLLSPISVSINGSSFSIKPLFFGVTNLTHTPNLVHVQHLSIQYVTNCVWACNIHIRNVCII